MRFLKFIFTAGSTLLLFVHAQGAPLLPDVQVEITEISQVTRNSQPAVQFSTGAVNRGTGPIELRRVSTANGMAQIVQRIFKSEGGYEDVPTGSFVVDNNNRVRFTDSADYFLKEVTAGDGVGGILSTNEKVAYCWVDSLKASSPPTGTPANAQYGGALYAPCGDVLGTSVGWIDLYPTYFQSQYLPLTGISNGTYWIENVLDPLNRIVESNDNNNIQRVKFTVNTGLISEINLLGNGQPIVSGSATPALSDHTDFGYAEMGTGSVARTFTIQNAGSGTLSLTGASRVQVIGSEEFTVVAQPSSPIAAGGSGTFQVVFNPKSPGIKTATIRISNNDANEGTYDFAVQGSVLQVQELSRVEGGFRLTFDSQNGRNYRIEFKNELSDADWSHLADRAGTGVPISVTDSTSEPRRFYRVTVLP